MFASLVLLQAHGELYDVPYPTYACGAVHGFRNRRRPQVPQADVSRLPAPASLSESRIARRGREVPTLLELRPNGCLLWTCPEPEGLISLEPRFLRPRLAPQVRARTWGTLAGPECEALDLAPRT